MVFACRGEDQFARRDEAFLIGEPNRFSGADGCIRCLQTGDSHDGRDDEIYLRQSRYPNRTGRAVNNFDEAKTRIEKALLQSSGQLLG